MTVWNHSRKGHIEGRIIAEAGDFVDIELVVNHSLHYMAASNRGLVDEKGDVITVRRSLLVEVPEPVAARIREGQVTGYSINGEDV